MKMTIITSTFLSVLLANTFSWGSTTATGNSTDSFPFSNSVIAENSNVLATDNIYANLIEWFRVGKNVSFQEVQGAYAGRCYYLLQPTSAIASILFVGENLIADHGPAFPRETSKKMVVLIKERESETFFDGWTTALVRDKAYDAWHIYNEAIENPLSCDKLESNYKLHVAIVKYNDYLIVNSIYDGPDIQGELPNGSQITIKAGDSTGACYYFKEFHPTP